MIRILHLSDFHYKNQHDADFRNIGQKIATALAGENINLVVFSGDLVFDTKEYDKLELAESCLIEPIKSVTGLNNNKILIAPGNHDMKRDAELPFIQEAFSTYNSYRQYDDFCANSVQLELSLANFEHYNNFIKEFYNGHDVDVQPLYTCHQIEIRGRRIGLIAFNSAWRCKKSEEDRGSLVYPVYMVNEALEKVDGCDFVFCVQHHNLSDYIDSVCQEIEDVINDKCHILFTGHYHKPSVRTIHDSEIGLLHLTAPATYNRGDKESQYGFSIIEIDEDIFEGTIYQFVKHEGNFVKIGEKPIFVPVSAEKRRLNSFRKLLRKRFLQTMEMADALFVNGEQGAFNSLFKDPVIKNKSLQEIITTKKEGDSFTLTDILNHEGKSSIVFGYNKRGKSSLLRWLQLDVLRNCVSRKIIPLFIDYKLYRRGKQLDLRKILHEYLEMNHKEVDTLFKEYKLLLLIDDFVPTDTKFVESLKTEMANYIGSRFIATSAESMSKQCALMNFDSTDVDKYYIHDITNKEVHQLTLSWPNIDKNRKLEIEDKILQMSKHMHISLNYWAVSLLLWIFEKTDENSIRNNFELVKLYVDKLLGKKDFIENQNFDVDYDDLLSYLSEMTEHILGTDDYALEEKELVDFTESYKQSHLKFTVAAWDIISYLLEQGVLHKVDEKYTIRLKGVFEFLLAYRMCENEKLLQSVLNDRHAFISFGNELEYYAGFRKNDFPTISKVFESAKVVLHPFTSRPDFNLIDERLENNVLITNEYASSTGKLIERLNDISDDEDQYELMPVQASPVDETVLSPKAFVEKYPINASNVEHVLFILARIYRNSNACNNEDLAQEMFDYILTGTCNLGYLLVDEAKNQEKKDETAKDLVSLISNFMPIIIEAFFYDAISQKNLSEVFKNKLDELLKNPQNNQLRIFLICYVLIDLDIKEYYPLVGKALEVIDNKVLRYAILNKNILLSIRHYDNPNIQGMLAEQRKELTLEFYKSYQKLSSEVDNRLRLKASKEMQQKQIIISDYNKL